MYDYRRRGRLLFRSQCSKRRVGSTGWHDERSGSVLRNAHRSVADAGVGGHRAGGLHPNLSECKETGAAWDCEDEDISDTVDRKLSAVIWITSVALIVSYFLIAASYSGGFATFDSKNSTIIFFIGVVAFFGIMAEATIIQQKCVDTAKQTNPEKKASVYDMRFQKKWIDDCDEAEKIMIGKCAFKAYSATNVVCTVLAIVLAVCVLVFDIGFLPSLMVCLVWIVNLSVYCKEAMRYSKAGNKIS